jgi:N-hydroxyarylamine O-acetyltransferase
MTEDTLAPATLERVLTRFGFSRAPAPTRASLVEVYRAWCRNVPFDNVRKRIALQRGDAGGLPGGTADDFFTAWLGHGPGGTCWPTSNGLYTLLRSLGFAARRISASMQDMGMPNHGSVIVAVEGQDHLVDSSILCEVPLPLRHDETFEITDPVHPIRIEPAGDLWLLWWGFTMSTDLMACRLLEDPVDLPFYLKRYEISREMSPFNASLYARRNRDGELVSFVGRTRFSKTAAGVTSQELSESQLAEALVADLGLSGEQVAELKSVCGL